MLVDLEHERRGVEWTLWRMGEAPDVGKVEANSAHWFEVDYGRAAALWEAFASQ